MNYTRGFPGVILVIALTGLFASGARAGWMANADFSACPREDVPQESGSEGPFDSEADCEARISSVQHLACATYECDDEGGGDSSSASLPSVPIPSGGLSAQQQLGVGLGVLGVYMVGKGLQELINGTPQQQAAERARQAAEEAARKRAAAEREKQLDATRDRLLKEIQGTGSDSPRQTQQLSLMGSGSGTNLQLMTGDQALAPMTTSIQKTAPRVPTFGKKKVKHSDAFHKGYFDGSQCYSQNAGPYCNGLAGDTWQTCLADYRAGYEVGTKEMAMKVKEAIALGRMDEESGKPNNGFSDLSAVGDCRTQLTEAYNNGYTQGQRGKAAAGKQQ